MAQIPAGSLKRGSGGSRRILVVAAGSRARGEGFFRSSSREVVFFVADHDRFEVYRNRERTRKENVYDSVLLVESTVVESKIVGRVLVLSHTWSPSTE